MKNIDAYNEFKNREEALKTELERMNKKDSMISTFRVISFLAALVLLIIGISDKVVPATVFGCLAMVVFVVLVKLHSDVVKNIEILKSKICVTDRYIKRFNDEWREFKENGKEYVENNDHVASDVDLLGDNSLYQMISVCHTGYGKDMLSETMKLQNINVDNIKERNEAVKELMDKYSFAIDYEAAGIRLEGRKKKFSPDRFEKYCADENAGKLPAWANIVRIICPLVEIGLLIAWITGLVGYAYPLIGFIVFLSLTWLTKTVTDSVIGHVYGINLVIDDYQNMLKIIAETDFESSVLKDIHQNISGEDGSLKAFKVLAKISQAYNLSFNPLLHQVLSGIVLWDYQLAYFVCKWKEKYGKNLSGTFKSLGKVEELMSLAVVGMVRKTGWANISNNEKDVRLSGDKLYHPLINPEKVQANSADIGSGITIITGSNMSGKTTFLRTLAINLALAYMGAPICGDRLDADYMKIFTSMRVTDDVANGISTFYAEILRIKEMAEYRQKGLPMLCLIDEIFKGTNSSDRIVGAKEVITRLAGEKSMTIVSTHDFELCSLKSKDNEDAVNYHFEEYYENNELKFDYKIKDGRCTTTNARAILRMAGFDVSDAV